MINEFSQEDFKIIGCGNENSEVLAHRSISYWQNSWKRFKENKVAFCAMLLLIFIIVLVIIGPYLSKYDLETMDMVNRNKWPGSGHWFGTDKLGRDLFTRTMLGGRVSILIGVFGAAIVTLVGCVFGGIAAYFGGKVDLFLMRIVEILSSVPHLLVVILISIVLDSKSVPTLLFAMTITGWCSIARLVRSQMLQISRSEYVMAAKIMGVSPIKIVFQHLIPNTSSVIIVDLTFRIPGFIFGEAFLSYVGLGVQSPATSWGALASAAAGSLLFYPYQIFFPTLLIALTMLSFTLMGDGLRDALDPKLWR